MNLTQKTFLLNDLYGNVVKVERCTLNDIDTHFELVKSFVPEEDHASYQDNMGVSVINRMAFKIGNDCFVYLNLVGNMNAEAYSLYGNKCPIKVMAMFSCILNQVHKRLLKISFFTHAGKTIQDFKSLLTETSIKRQVRPNYPVVIRCDYLRDKLNRVYKKRGVKWES